MRPFILPFVRLVVVGVLTLGVTTMGLSQPRLRPDFRYGIDSLRLKSMPQHTLDDILNHNRKQRTPTPVRKAASPQSQIYVIDTASVWNTKWQTRHLYSFNANAKKTSELIQYRKSNLWVDTLRDTYTYDASNLMISDLLESWSNGQWVSDVRHTYTYDARNNMLSDLREAWESGQWGKTVRLTYTYDASNNMLSYLDEYWSNGQWVNVERETYTYNGSDNMVSELDETWNGQWVNSYRYTYTYGASNDMLSDFCETWDWYNDLWKTAFRDTYTYDASGNRLTDLIEEWSNGQWVNFERRTYTYDAQENLTSVWCYSWLNSSWTFVDGSDYFSLWLNKYFTYSDGAGNRYSYVYCYNISLTYRLILPKEEERVQVWQELRLSSPGAFKSTLESNVVTFDGIKAKVTRASTDTVSVLVPPELVKNRTLTGVVPDTTTREVTVVVRVIKGAGDTVTVLQTPVLFEPPHLLIHDEVTRAAPALLQGVLGGAGWRFARTYIFAGFRTDGTAAVRLTNVSTAFPQPIELLAKVISPPPVTLFDATDWPSVGNLLSVGPQNAAIQFPIDKDGWYIIVVVGGPLPNPPVTPAGPNSPGPFLAQFQIHLAGNVGLPRKVNESPRGIRLDTYFNHPAPSRDTTLRSNGLVPGQWAGMGVFKFANPVSVSLFPIAVLIPPNLQGFPIGTPPVRATPGGGLLPNGLIDITVPMATTTGAALGTVIDLAQVPIPASVLYQGPPAGVARILGSSDGIAVTLGAGSSLIVDMGSGNEIVDGSGADFRVIALSGTYQVAVSNTPFSDTFVPVGSGTGQHDFDLAGTGLSSARYVRLTVSTGSASFDAVQALNLFTDEVDPTAGPLADAGWATITMRRQKAPSVSLNPYLELIGPDGSYLGENDSGFGDDLEPTRSDAALIKIGLTQQGFYRFLGRGYDRSPDATAFGTFSARLETAGAYDAGEISVSTKGEDLTTAQKQGTISLPRQRDSYLFQASAGTTVNIVVNGIGTQALADPIVELYDPEDFLIAANDNYPGRGRNAAVTVPLHPTGRAYPDPSTYRIVVMGVDTITSVTTSLSGSVCYVRKANGGKYELKVFTGALSGNVSKTPTVTSVSPDAAIQGATSVYVTLNGTNFVSGATVTFSGTGITVTTVAFTSASQLNALIKIDSSAAKGKRDVTVTNPDGKTVTAIGLFDIRASLGSVTLNWEAPDSNVALGSPKNLNSVWGTSGTASKAMASKANVMPAPKRLLTHGGRKAHILRTAADPIVFDAPLLSPAVNEVEPNNTIAQAQKLTGDTLIVVNGHAQVRDNGELWTDDDDIEDLFKVTTVRPGLSILLDGFTSDCDLFLIDLRDTSFVDYSMTVGATEPEEIVDTSLAAGTYLIGVSIYDPDPIGPDSTAYVLHVQGKFTGGSSTTLSSYSIYRSTMANARQTGQKVGSVAAGTRYWSDAIPYVGRFYYQVTAMYGSAESAPSNEATALVTFISGEKAPLAASFELLQNYPNPFNPSTTIRYALPRRSTVTLTVFNTLGQQVVQLVHGEMEAGYHEVRFDGSALSSGVYFYRMQAVDPSLPTERSFVQTRKLLLLR